MSSRGEIASWPPCLSSKGPTRVNGSSSCPVSWPGQGPLEHCPAPLDTEVSRRHAELRLDREGYRIVDLGSANGTYVNGQAVDQTALASGDRVQLGQTVMLFQQANGGTARDLTARVDLLTKSSPDDRSAILKSIPSGEGSRVLQAPDAAAGWLRERLMNLSVMYRATQAITMFWISTPCRPRSSNWSSSRSALTVARSSSKTSLVSSFPRRSGGATPAQPDERMTISQTIVDYVLNNAKASSRPMRRPTRDSAPLSRSSTTRSARPSACRSREGTPRWASFTPMSRPMSRPSRPSVASPPLAAGSARTSSCSWWRSAIRRAWRLRTPVLQRQDRGRATRRRRPDDRHLVPPHQEHPAGHPGGSYLIDLGLKEKDEAIVRRGWTIVDKNQTKIYNMVMDMLSFSKEREPALEPSDLNETIGDVVELMQSRPRNSASS